MTEQEKIVTDTTSELIMIYTDQQLALNFIKCGITPLFLEQSPKIVIRKRVDLAGFSPEDLQIILERWDIHSARKIKEKSLRNDYDRASWAKKKEIQK